MPTLATQKRRIREELNRIEGITFLKAPITRPEVTAVVDEITIDIDLVKKVVTTRKAPGALILFLRSLPTLRGFNEFRAK